MMGVWFLANSLGNLISRLLAGGFSEDSLSDWPALYFETAAIPFAAGILLILLSRYLKGWMSHASKTN